MLLDRSVSVRVLILTVLAFLVVIVLVAWGSSQYLRGRSDFWLARVAYQVSAFPDRVVEAFDHIGAELAEGSAERFFRVPADVDPVSAGYRLIGDGILIKVDQTRASRGWRYVAGAFRVDGIARNAVALINPDFALEALWTVDENELRETLDQPSDVAPEDRKMIHGLEVFRDGSFAFAFDMGWSMQRMSVCDGVTWATYGRFHHSVTEQDGLLWGLRDFNFGPVGEGGENHFWGQTGLVALDGESGQIRHEISVDQLRVANPDISLFDIPRDTLLGPTENRASFGDSFMNDPYHLNDVEPLPAEFADQFEGFETGYLLVSSRTLNTIFVVNPDTLEVVWHTTGLTRRQHDPDWGRDGRITVFDNRMGLGHSEIVAFDPESRSRDVLYDGKANAFYTYIRGKHAVLENGGLSIVSSQQGRAFETDPNTGDIVFEIYSTNPGDPAVNYFMTSLITLPEDALSKEDFQCNET